MTHNQSYKKRSTRDNRFFLYQKGKEILDLGDDCSTSPDAIRMGSHYRFLVTGGNRVFQGEQLQFINDLRNSSVFLRVADKWSWSQQ